ncbi:rRNA-processing protein las1 [Thoreauomyces humboldtii]|nr:rRNA-processing protein las1 [Thoreauomyces humboldtii]
MAFIRFVNGVVDANQKGMYATSVANIAVQLGLPGWFVDLRHAGTHDRLPALPLLRTGCTQALQWLHANYWTLQRTYLADAVADVHSLLTQYKTAMKGRLKGVTPTRPQLIDTEQALIEIVTLLTTDTYREILLPTLLEIGFLVPTATKKRPALPDMILPEALERLWSPALARFELAWPGFAEDLFLLMVDALTTVSDENGVDAEDAVAVPSESYLITLASWSKHCLTTYILAKGSGWDLPLEACLRNPTALTVPLIQRFAISVPSLAPRLDPLLAYITRSLSVPDPHRSDHPPSAQPLASNDVTETAVRDLARKADTVKRDSIPEVKRRLSTAGIPVTQASSGWSLYPVSEWRTCPIGCLPGGTLPNLELPDWFEDAEELVRRGILVLPAIVPDCADGAEPTDARTETAGLESTPMDLSPAEPPDEQVENEGEAQEIRRDAVAPLAAHAASVLLL